ncbi:MAG: hypothetical protein GYB49_17265 [Alphaproteobacteria bacterium]|nr:hypothetical protein [Hyphomonas sp.]MBR9808965.1 hypothetical protein [Alphaproteobacteria bacterium]|tara:strand:+ start:3164 stop:3373 length:210 start_codon:yes stop_codon:yes gene_type:complete
MNLWKTIVTASQTVCADTQADVRRAVHHARLGTGEFDHDATTPMTDMAHALRTRRQPRPAPGLRAGHGI